MTDEEDRLNLEYLFQDADLANKEDKLNRIKLTDRQLTQEYPLSGNVFHLLQDLLTNLESYLDMPLEHRTTENDYSLLHFAQKVVAEAVKELEADIVADVISSDNKTRD